MSLGILGSKCEDVEDYFPARLDELGLLVTKSCHAHDNILLDLLLARVQVVQHYSLKWFKEHLLVTEVSSLFLFQELVCELTERVNGVDDYMKVLVGANPSEMFSKGAPNTLPLETYPIHIERCYLNKLLETELLRAVFIGELLP